MTDVDAAVGTVILERLRAQLTFLYGDAAPAVLEELVRVMASHAARSTVGATGGDRGLGPRLDQRTAVLISYADSIVEEGVAPLATLRSFLREHVRDAVGTIHLLPFFPSTSDDGFSVADYLAVDPAVGGWDDVARLGQDYELMFDAVLNHVSAASAWFQGFLSGDERYRGFFRSEDPTADLSAVVRPRTSPLLTRFDTARGPEHVWTTFSADQVDLDYRTPEVLLEIVRVLLAYVERGSRILRLDAITYLWKEVGTPSVHHPKTHAVLRVLRAVIDAVAPGVALLTETNVPHHENVAYFGAGDDAAHMVYNFALPPLVLHAIGRADARALQAWAATLATPSATTCFFNFLASHDGIGLRPVEDLLPGSDVEALVERVRAAGGLVSYRSDADGGRRPYELNVALYDALADPGGEPLTRRVDRFACAHAVMLALAGVPALYVHSLLGSVGDLDAVRATGKERSINRTKLRRDVLQAELADPEGRRTLVLRRLTRLLRARRGEPCFHPGAGQRVLDLGPGTFALLRVRGARSLLALHDVSGAGASLPLAALAREHGLGDTLQDVVTGASRAVTAGLELPPYGVAWLVTSGR